MLGPPKFDPTMGDRLAGPPPLPPSVTLVPRERTQVSPGTGSSARPLRLTLGPCASLPPDLMEDPMVARLVSSADKGYVIMYTRAKTMSIPECETLPITTLPDFDIKPGKPRDKCLSIKLPRTNLDHQDLLDKRRLAIKSGGTLTVEGSYIWDLALL